MILLALYQGLSWQPDETVFLCYKKHDINFI